MVAVREPVGPVVLPVLAPRQAGQLVLVLVRGRQVPGWTVPVWTVPAPGPVLVRGRGHGQVGPQVPQARPGSGCRRGSLPPGVWVWGPSCAAFPPSDWPAGPVPGVSRPAR